MKCNHDWKDLTLSTSWCKKCGTLRIDEVYPNRYEYFYPNRKRLPKSTGKKGRE